MFLYDELTPQRNHEQDAKPSAKKSQRKNPPESELRAKAQENERGDCEHHPSGQRFSGRAGRLDDVVFENGRAAERAKNTDGEDGDGNGSRNGEPGAQPDIHRHCSEEQSE